MIFSSGIVLEEEKIIYYSGKSEVNIGHADETALNDTGLNCEASLFKLSYHQDTKHHVN